MQCESRLTLDASAAEYVVDVANVVREPGLGGERQADLARLDGVLDAVAQYAHDPAVQVYAITDRSLLTDGRLTAVERARLERWYGGGLLEVLPRADDRILELADALDVQVISSDNFLEFHRSHPWIPGCRDRFLRPVLGEDGVIGVRMRIMPVPPQWQVSRKEEEGLLLEAGVLRRWSPTGHQAVLSRDWRCPDPGCPQFGAGERPRAALPRRRKDRVLCPTHGVPLIDAGPRPRRAQVKVVMDGTVRGRFMVTAGEPVAVGRAPRDGGIALGTWIDDRAVDSVSRTHVLQSYDGTALTVVDELSANGTRVRRSRTSGDELVPLQHGVHWTLRRGDAIVLHERLELLPSGRQFVFEEDGTDGTVGPQRGRTGTPTMMIVPRAWRTVCGGGRAGRARRTRRGTSAGVAGRWRPGRVTGTGRIGPVRGAGLLRSRTLAGLALVTGADAAGRAAADTAAHDATDPALQGGRGPRGAAGRHRPPRRGTETGVGRTA